MWSDRPRECVRPKRAQTVAQRDSIRLGPIKHDDPSGRGAASLAVHGEDLDERAEYLVCERVSLHPDLRAPIRERDADARQRMREGVNCGRRAIRAEYDAHTGVGSHLRVTRIVTPEHLMRYTGFEILRQDASMRVLAHIAQERADQ